jgi:hypothetical protein
MTMCVLVHLEIGSMDRKCSDYESCIKGIDREVPFHISSMHTAYIIHKSFSCMTEQGVSHTASNHQLPSCYKLSIMDKPLANSAKYLYNVPNGIIKINRSRTPLALGKLGNGQRNIILMI